MAQRGLTLLCRVLFFFAGCTEDDAGGSEGEEGAVFDNPTFTGIEFYIVDEGACVAVVVFQGVAKSTSFVAANGDGAVIQVDAGINGLKGAVGWIAFLIATNDIVAHMKGNDLFEMEDILDDHDGTAAFFIGLFVRILVFLTLTEFADAYTDAELLATIRAFEDQRLTCGVLGLVEGDILVTFGASYTFHNQLYLYTQASASSL